MMILPILKKFWLPITITIASLLVIGYVYNAGKRSCEAKVNRVIIEEQLRHEQEIDELLKRGIYIKDKIREKLTDKQSSCILSNNPFKKDCDL